ncbi:MAG: hypothetical protein KBG43_10295, partial [Paludibacteraceae bacterium]|nr:hypothetical protein [Paludibacteraceae bacterium]
MHSCNTFPTDLIFFYRKTGDRHEVNHNKKTGCMKPVLRKKAKLQELNSGSYFFGNWNESLFFSNYKGNCTFA